MDHPIPSHRGDKKRSRSPRRERSSKRPRSRSPHHHHRQDRESAIRLPFRRDPLDKRSVGDFTPLFAEYLDVQKHLDIDDLNSDEVKGRWKSFLHKWNRGQLAEGWYDPDMQQRVEERYNGRRKVTRAEDEVVLAPTDGKALDGEHGKQDHEEDDDDGDDDGYGPTLPALRRAAGPAIPGRDDLQYREELVEQDRALESADRRHARQQDRHAQKERLEELAPRAAPGTRERQLEKKRDAAAANRAFREAGEAGVVEEVGDADLMGDNEGVAGYRAKLKAQERRKTEREIRKEEAWRARAAEREEKLAGLRVKEEKTMDMLRAIAKQRFG